MRRSAELEQRRLELEEESDALARQVRQLAREVEIREWVVGYGADLARLRDQVRQVAVLEAEAAAAERRAAQVEAGAATWRTAHAAARDPAIRAGAISVARDRATRADDLTRFHEESGRVAVAVFGDARATVAAGRSTLPARSWPALAGATNLGPPGLITLFERDLALGGQSRRPRPRG